MKKNKLSEMTLEELWELFPIFLVEHNDKWIDDYKEIESVLKELLFEYTFSRISHIGSTAISDICSKNIVDVLVEIPTDEDMKTVADVIEKSGFILMSSEPERMSFNKGYTIDGFADRVYHIHLRYAGDNDELFFRDYLNEYPEVAAEYEKLKLALWKKFEHDRDAYTNAKTDFVKYWTEEARKKYGNRYGNRY